MTSTSADARKTSAPTGELFRFPKRTRHRCRCAYLLNNRDQNPGNKEIARIFLLHKAADKCANWKNAAFVNLRKRGNQNA